MSKLQNKVAIVTGASKGIGASIAKHLAAEGAAVVVNYSSSKEGADRVVADIAGGGGKAVAVQANVAKQAEIERLFAEAKKAFGKVDILVNNAGIYDFSPIEAVTEEHFHKQFDLNVLGLILASQAASKHFGTAGGQHHQHQLSGEHHAGRHCVGLQRDESRRRCGDEIASQGAWAAQHPRELDQSRDGGYRGSALRWNCRERFPKAG